MPDIFLADKSAASAIDRCTTNCLAVSATGGARPLGRFAVPDIFLADKSAASAIDRCTKILVLHLPPAADKDFAQSKRLALLASCRSSLSQNKNQEIAKAIS